MLLKQRISTFLMLSVILPMVFLAPFHHHAQPVQEEVQCESCLQHQHHSGHLTSSTSTDECLICRLLGQQYFPSALCSVKATAAELTIDCGHFSDDIPSCSVPHSSPRAPPVSFCF